MYVYMRVVRSLPGCAVSPPPLLLSFFAPSPVCLLFTRHASHPVVVRVLVLVLAHGMLGT